MNLQLNMMSGSVVRISIDPSDRFINEPVFTFIGEITKQDLTLLLAHMNDDTFIGTLNQKLGRA